MNEVIVKITKCDVRTASLTRRERGRTTDRVYISQNDNPNEKPLMDLISGFRYNKPYTLYRRKVMPEVLKRMGYPDNTKVRWSQYAGCSCPCSPGFIVNLGRYPIGGPKEVFVDVDVKMVQPDLL